MSISVLMAIYHKEKPEYFELALESIWDKQSLKPNEIILVEDGALTSELDALILRWKSKLPQVLKVIKLKVNKGLSTALNEGLKHCSCKYIARMDSDDISHPERFRKQFDYLEKNEDIYVLGGSIQEFNDKCDSLIVRHYPIDFNHIKKYIAKASPLAHATVMFRITLFASGIKYSEKHITSQDIELWYRVVKAGYRISNIPEVTYYVRVSSDFYVRRTRKKAINEFKIYWNGIIELYGYNWRLVFPILRVISRLMPAFIVKLLYSKKIRNILNPSKKFLKNRNND